MSTSAFDDKASPPAPDRLAAVLAEAWSPWEGLLRSVGERYPAAQPQWKYYSKKSGWSLVFRENKNTLFYLLPRPGSFLIWVTLGQAAAQASAQAPLPPAVHQAIASATPYAEGRSFFVPIATEQDLTSLWTLLELKAR